MKRFTLYLIIVSYVVLTIMANPLPGSTKHIRHRIYVPHKIHTVYVTKLVKVPEHHHHHHYIKKKQHHFHHHSHQESKLEDDNFKDFDDFEHDNY